MAVSPALTYPSKAIRMGLPVNTVSLYFLRLRAVSPNMVAAIRPTAIAQPNLMTRIEIAVIQDLNYGPTLTRTLYVTKRRVQAMAKGTTVIQTFPIPYNPKEATRPIDGPIWPRVEKPTR